MVKKGSGWYGESRRHAEAVKKGLKTRYGRPTTTTKRKWNLKTVLEDGIKTASKKVIREKEQYDDSVKTLKETKIAIKKYPNQRSPGGYLLSKEEIKNGVKLLEQKVEYDKCELNKQKERLERMKKDLKKIK